MVFGQKIKILVIKPSFSDFFYKFKIYKYLIILLDISILSGPHLNVLQPRVYISPLPPK